MTIDVRTLRPQDVEVLENVTAGVFDLALDVDLVREFLRDPRHHIAVAIESSQVVGFTSAVHYVHPDKSPQLWINEVGVAPSHQARGIGKLLMNEILELARRLGCVEAWVLTESDNTRAIGLYTSAGGSRENDS